MRWFWQRTKREMSRPAAASRAVKAAQNEASESLAAAKEQGKKVDATERAANALAKQSDQLAADVIKAMRLRGIS